MTAKDITDELRQSALWVVAFVGVCIMVGLGKVKPETIEYLLFAMLGAAGTKRMKGKDNEPGQ